MFSREFYPYGMTKILFSSIAIIFVLHCSYFNKTEIHPCQTEIKINEPYTPGDMVKSLSFTNSLISIVQPRFNDILEMENGKAIVRVKDKWGIIDSGGHYLLKPEYDRVNSVFNSVVLVKLNDKRYIVNFHGSIIGEFREDDIDEQVYEHTIRLENYFSEGLKRVFVNGKYGFINDKGEIVIAPKFEEAAEFKNGVSVFKKNNKFGLIDIKGNIILQPTYYKINQFENGKSIVSESYRFGLINNKGKLLIPIEFQNISEIKNGMLWAEKKEEGKSKHFLFDNDDKLVISEYFDHVVNFEDDVSIVTLNEKAGLIDKYGKALIAFDNDSVSKLNGKYFAVKSNDEWRVFSVLSLKYENIQFNAYNGLGMNKNAIRIRMGNQWGVYELGKGIVVNPIYDEINTDFSFHGGFLRIVKDGLSGIMDKEFNIIVPPKYEGLNIRKGYFVLKDKNSESILNIDGSISNINKYSEVIQNLSDGKFIVKIDKSYAIVDKLGKFILSPKYSEMHYHSGVDDNNDRFIIVVDKELYGIYDSKLNKFVTPQYDNIERSSIEYFFAKKNGKWGLIDMDNNIILPFIFGSFNDYGPKSLEYSFNGYNGIINFEKCLVR